MSAYCDFPLPCKIYGICGFRVRCHRPFTALQTQHYSQYVSKGSVTPFVRCKRHIPKAYAEASASLPINVQGFIFFLSSASRSLVPVSLYSVTLLKKCVSEYACLRTGRRVEMLTPPHTQTSGLFFLCRLTWSMPLHSFFPVDGFTVHRGMLVYAFTSSGKYGGSPLGARPRGFLFVAALPVPAPPLEENPPKTDLPLCK